jgi:hypothetical protein
LVQALNCLAQLFDLGGDLFEVQPGVFRFVVFVVVRLLVGGIGDGLGRFRNRVADIGQREIR